MWIDISRPLCAGMPGYPGDPAFEIKPLQSGGASVSALSMSTHTGTHVDAPRHILPGGAGVDQITVDALCGPAVILSDIAAASLAPRVLWRAGGRTFTPAQAVTLARSGVVLIGTDAESVGEGETELEVHRVLLSRGIVIVEGLDLSRAPDGMGMVICAPLLILGADGAPARCFWKAGRSD